ncbi:MAG: hypothetical protein AAGC44_15690 [Planctomycetota bacterium]
MQDDRGLARARHVGRWKIKQQLDLAAAAYHHVRMRRLLLAGRAVRRSRPINRGTHRADIDRPSQTT